MSRLIRWVMLLTAIFWTTGCQRPAQVNQPAGWQVLAFEMTATGGSMQFLRVDSNSFEIRGEGQVRGQIMKTTMRGDKTGTMIVVEWVDSAGNRRTGTPVQGRDGRWSMQFLQKAYYIGTVFPSKQEIKARLGTNLAETSYCGRQAYEVRRSNRIELIDAQTGIRLATLRLPDRTVTQSLRTAKWTLKKGKPQVPMR